MKTIKTKDLPSLTLTEVVGNDANGKTGKQTVGSFAVMALLGKLIGADFNTTNDQLITLSGGTTFIVTDIVVTNASVNMTAASASNWFTGQGQTGIRVAKSANFFEQNLVTPQDFMSALWNAAAGGQGIQMFTPSTIGNTIYFSLGGAQGAPATADMFVYGYIVA